MNSYERIKKFIPVFYQDVLEMDAIYRTDGEMIDELLSNIDVVKANRYIQSADETKIAELERFFGLQGASKYTLEERRNLLTAYYTGFGKLSSTSIKNIIKAMSEADSEVDLSSADASGNNRLNIQIIKPVSNYSLEDIIDLLLKRIPGHIPCKFGVYHEKNTEFFVGVALHQGSHKQISIPGVDAAEFDWLTDENGDNLLDEDGFLLYI